jgi:DNA segregation ATPase FtsK/SpoIIIE, S-DNA-T family
MAKNSIKQNTFKDKKEPQSFKGKMNVNFLHDRRFHLAMGFLLMTIGLFLLVSFISYLFTGKYDQSVVEAIGTEASKDLGLESKNWLGLLGAWSSNLFIFKWFGIAAFLIPPLSFFSGLEIITRRPLFSLWRFSQLVVFALLWLSLFLGYLVYQTDGLGELQYLCGAVGYEIVVFLHSLIGWGTLLFLGLTLTIFIIFYIDINNIFSFGMQNSKESEEIESEEEDNILPVVNPFKEVNEKEVDEAFDLFEDFKAGDETEEPKEPSSGTEKESSSTELIIEDKKEEESISQRRMTNRFVILL